MMRILVLAVVALLATACGGEDLIASQSEAIITDGPGCVNGDCPEDPGCTDGGCTPNDEYKADCCCANLDDGIRICCCKSDMVMQCRETYGPTHLYLDEVRICMGQVPSGKAGSTTGPCTGSAKAAVCAPDWFPAKTQGAWWPEGCGWMNQVAKCAK
jgi:hypothetical protein